MSKNRITYIFGAGASRHALPLVSEFQKSLRELISALPITADVPNRESIVQFAQDLNWLAEQGDKHQTIDSFAKFCYNKRLDNKHWANFIRTKRTLAHYFSIMQIIENKRDNRYLNFLHRLIDGENPFPSNVKILNWNYDFQMQIASNEYLREELVESNKHRPSLIHYYPTLGAYGNALNGNPNLNFDMVHLNGIAGYYFDWSSNSIMHHNLDYGIGNVQDYFSRILMKPVENLYSTLSFAFEKSTEPDYVFLKDKRKYIENLVVDTDYLVVIGYSFPRYNSEMDDFIFSFLKRSKNFKKIIIQNASPSGDFPYARFKLNQRIVVEQISNCTSFHIPEETYEEVRVFAPVARVI